MDRSENIYDVIVVGAGVEGTATGLSFARRGVKTLILEQFGLYHTRGSSTGESRVIRKTYQEAIYVAMMVDAYKLWEEIEKECGELILRKCGGLTIGFSEETIKEVIMECDSQMKNYKIPHEILGGQEIRKRWPMLGVKDEVVGLWDPTMGILYARKSMIAMMNQFSKRGGVVRENRKVIGIEQIEGKGGQTVVKVSTHRKESFFCKKIVLCTGPWTNKVLSLVNLQIPISPEKVVTPFWKIQENRTEPDSFSNAPVFSFWKTPTELYYSVPEYEYPGLLKIAPHGSIPCDPDERDFVEDLPSYILKLSGFISDTFQPGLLGNKPSIVERCIVSMTRDTHPIIDVHPIFRNVYFCAGFSGHGFKLAPVIGELVADMVCGTETKFDLKFFRLSRFTKHKL